MNISRAKTLCGVVHEQAMAWHLKLNFSMAVRGSNGTGTYKFNKDADYHVIEQTNKDSITEVLPILSDLEIGTISNVTFMTVDDSIHEFVEHVIDELRMKGIYLWTLNGNELLFKVLKSGTTPAQYQAMLNKYNAAGPGPTKVNKKGYPHREFAQPYNRIPVRCEQWDAYPASYTRPDCPTRPAKHCGSDAVDWAPDGTLWKVECQPERRKRVCRWKFDDGQPRLKRAGTASMQFQRVKQIGSTRAGRAARPVLPPPRVKSEDEDDAMVMDENPPTHPQEDRDFIRDAYDAFDGEFDPAVLPEPPNQVADLVSRPSPAQGSISSSPHFAPGQGLL